MANERTYPLLPCRDVDEAVTFYEALGFTRTYHQLRPDPDALYRDFAAGLRARYQKLAELAVRVQNEALAQTSLAAIEALDLSDAERESLAEEVAQTIELVQGKTD
jgi:catechol 2,3-dioxygenase-like lactoylglutathione lyase family enzyme